MDEFIPLSEIYLPRSKETREEVYENAKKKLKEVMKKAKDWGIMTDQIEEVLNLDYDYIKKYNDLFDQIDDINISQTDKLSLIHA